MSIISLSDILCVAMFEFGVCFCFQTKILFSPSLQNIYIEMIANTLKGVENGKEACVFGKVDTMEGSVCTLLCNDNKIKVIFGNVEEYQNKCVMVHGIVENECLKEKIVVGIEDNFDFSSLKLLIDVEKKVQDIY